ncbi:integrase core domain-containing protein [Pseudonocardia charpentierae]|uniref:Integrase core domain-containing protein n=1 Tax=Pseudonocardia charpentierae TaxID=3075545 RepID=A0ABU2NIM2_9PSEU|nr:integrase core domain-containing protein [Pseudonocardia sp. DSM 45834]MDT0353820.1 integrase core domain-containing protein [Pseudonocardia sp. DSM 45834]
MLHQVGSELGLVASTVGRILHRNQVPALTTVDPITGLPVRRRHSGIRYERRNPGDLLHHAVAEALPGGWCVLRRPAPTMREVWQVISRATRPPRRGIKKWLDHQPHPQMVRQLQALLDEFRGYYNTTRPHRALAQHTPAQAYSARPKAVPTGTPVDTGHYRVRHDRIDNSGVITLRHNSRLHHIGLGRRL